MSLFTVKSVVEKAIREYYESRISTIVYELSSKYKNELNIQLETLNTEVKKKGQQLTLEILQEIDTDGLSVKFKL